MKSIYKKLGNYIEEVIEKNSDLEVTLLLGVSITKQFIPSIANTIGTDMSNYKIVRKNQFAYGPVTSRNGDKISVALLDKDICIVSTSYTVFKIINTDLLDPEYLMVWFRRAEFDRYARFKSHGSVRELFDWNELCDVELPILSIEEQRKVVQSYNSIQSNININFNISSLVDEQLSCLYSKLIEKPYFDNSEQNEWKKISIQELIDSEVLYPNQDGNHGEIHPKSSDYKPLGIPFIMANDVINGVVDLLGCKFIDKSQADNLRIGFAKENDVLITHKATMGRVAIVPPLECEYIMLTPQVTYYRIKDSSVISKEYLYCSFLSREFQNAFCNDGEQSTRSYLGITNQRKLNIILPDKHSMDNFSKLANPLLKKKMLLNKKNYLLNETLKILMTRLSVG